MPRIIENQHRCYSVICITVLEKKRMTFDDYAESAVAFAQNDVNSPTTTRADVEDIETASESEPSVLIRFFFHSSPSYTVSEARRWFPSRRNSSFSPKSMTPSITPPPLRPLLQSPRCRYRDQQPTERISVLRRRFKARALLSFLLLREWLFLPLREWLFLPLREWLSFLKSSLLHKELFKEYHEEFLMKFFRRHTKKHFRKHRRRRSEGGCRRRRRYWRRWTTTTC